MTSAADERVGAALWRVAFILVLGTFMATLDATIVTVGLDTLISDFDATVTEIQWVTTAYLLAVVAAIPASGWLADRFGGRRVWITAAVVFLIGSLLCALAWSATSLVLFRVVQGLGGGLLPPVGQALLARVAGPRRIGRILSVVAVVPLLSPVFGPLIGGSILAVADWPWLFYVNLPVGLAAVLLARRYVPVVPPSAPDQRFDIRGAVLLSAGLAVMVLGLTSVGDGNAVGPVVAVAAVVGGTGMLAAFVCHGLWSRRRPLIDPRLLRQPPIGAATLALAMLGASVFGATFLLPLYLQAGQELTPWQAGLLIAPQGAGAVVGSLVVKRTIDRTNPRTLVVIGILLIAVGTAAFTQLGHAPPDWLVVASLLVRGLGIAMIGAPVMNLVYSTVAPVQLPRASTVLNLASTVGGSLGTAVLAMILQSRLSARGEDTEGVPLAFADTFWWALGFCVIALVGASRLAGRSPAAESAAPAAESEGERG